MKFEQFAKESGPRIRAGLIAAFGPDLGADAAADALAYGWEHWDRVGKMENPAGYLYRVGQTSGQRANPKPRFLPAPPPQELPNFEPGLLPALEELTESQRVAVLLVYAFGWTQTATAELLDVDPSTIRTHLARGLKKLQAALKVEPSV